MEIYPELQPLLSALLMESLDSCERNIKLIAALHLDIYGVFHKYLNHTNPNRWYDEPYHSSVLEIVCQMYSRQQFLELLDNGAKHHESCYRYSFTTCDS
jgi:hypothetical protein